jgi:hypothetical protein
MDFFFWSKKEMDIFFYWLSPPIEFGLGSVLTSSGSSPFRSQLWGIEPWSSLSSSASITTELTNDIWIFLKENEN